MKSTNTPRVGIIGGTGLYDINGVEILKTVYPKTPWGYPSEKITLAGFKDEQGGGYLELAFLPRHGRYHSILPTEIPQKANIAALKMLGVDYIISFSAVGSLKEEISPTHFVLPSQIIDRTVHRGNTFYGNGIVVHISFGDPFSKSLFNIFEDVIRKLEIPLHTEETLICIEGPAFSTRAESKSYKSWGGGIINMSALPEAKLCRELEINYQMICMTTDHDSWREQYESVTAKEIMQVIKDNSKKANLILQNAFPSLIELIAKENPLKGSIKNSIITPSSKSPKKLKKKLNKLLPGYF